MLAGCVLDAERTELALDVPPAYRASAGARDGAPPVLDWWRGFGSPELIDLVEAAQTGNF
jgi:outer membrane protein TolC